MATAAPNNGLLNARAPGVMRTHLMGNPYNVHRHDFDDRFMDMSDEHRKSMRKILYGGRKSHETKRKSKTFLYLHWRILTNTVNLYQILF